MGESIVEYIPDIRVFLEDGREWWFEVKPEKRLLIRKVKQKMAAAELHFAATNRNFSIVTEALIWSSPLASNLQKILYHRRGPWLSPSHQAEVCSKLNKYKPRFFGEVVSIFGEMDAWSLLGLGIVGVDLEQTLTQGSEVFLSGGHRHANLFT
ncbi:Tn7 transposase TnsA N-terminal domain-containing protein [Pseudomonas chlororaphis]|uniref:Tn7 transposase TnsA N-terminal domain-containing protein n=1 Tax=Pseudomonas chlororaphis TaxID=587753 RepID=UPI001F15120F|nr:Tn7 transposase TnsA N-terminal domain-containing protein [Pseudomonas chlororaphis]